MEERLAKFLENFQDISVARAEITIYKDSINVFTLNLTEERKDK